jgi:predicted transcriptional regulator
MEKMTKKQKFEILKGIVVGTEHEEMLTAFLDREIELVSKKRASGSLTKTQKENLIVKDNIVAVLAEAEGAMRATEIATAMDLSVQKVSALVNALVKEGRVTRTEDSKKAVYFSVAN